MDESCIRMDVKVSSRGAGGKLMTAILDIIKRRLIRGTVEHIYIRHALVHIGCAWAIAKEEMTTMRLIL